MLNSRAPYKHFVSDPLLSRYDRNNLAPDQSHHTQNVYRAQSNASKIYTRLYIVVTSSFTLVLMLEVLNYTHLKDAFIQGGDYGGGSRGSPRLHQYLGGGGNEHLLPQWYTV